VRNPYERYNTSSQYNHPVRQLAHMTGVVINLTDLFRALPSMAYTSSLFRIVNKFHQEVISDSNVPIDVHRPIDFRAVALEHDRLLSNYRQE
jgi:hypothetical protein